MRKGMKINENNGINTCRIFLFSFGGTWWKVFMVTILYKDLTLVNQEQHINICRTLPNGRHMKQIRGA